MVRMNLMGVVMLAELLETYRRGIVTLLRKGVVDPFERVRPLLREADVNMINLECVLSDSSIHRRPFSEILISPESFLRYFLDNGINVMTTANNHALDHGREAFDRTVRLLRDNDVTVIGYDIDRFFQESPAVVETGGMRLGFLGYNISNFPEPDRSRTVERILDVIRNARGSVDKLIVSMHWGEEYTNIPPPYVVMYGRRILDAGCDILHGHHSHHLQGVIRDGNRIFAPSLGNFIFDQMVDRNRITAVLRVEIEGNGDIGHALLPYYENDSYQPEDAPRFAGYLEELNSYVEKSWQEGNEEIYADLVSAMVSRGHRDNRIRMRARMLAHFWDYLPYLGKIAAMKRSGGSMYSVIRDEESLGRRSGS